MLLAGLAAKVAASAMFAASWLGAFSESEAAQIRMIVGAAAQRPMIFAAFLAHGQIIDRRMARRRQAC
jgi:hypothetical protein